MSGAALIAAVWGALGAEMDRIVWEWPGDPYGVFGSPQTLAPRYDIVDLSAHETSPRVVVRTPRLFRRHMLVMVTRTGEIMRVLAHDLHGLDVQRAVNHVRGPLRAGDEVLIVGSAR